MQLWLARHAQPVLPAGICYGTLDVDVNDQAKAWLLVRLNGYVMSR